MRLPFWSFGGWAAALDDVGLARRHAAGMFAEVEWTLRMMQMLRMMRGVDRWQAAFA